MLLPEGQTHKHALFQDFKEAHSKVYANESEEIQRLAAFHHNVRYINSVNRQVRPRLLFWSGPPV